MTHALWDALLSWDPKNVLLYILTATVSYLVLTVFLRK